MFCTLDAGSKLVYKTKHVVLCSELEYPIMSASYSSENGLHLFYQTVCTPNLASFPSLFEKSDLGTRVHWITIERRTLSVQPKLENPDTMYKRKFGSWDAGSKLVYKTKCFWERSYVLSLSNQSRVSLNKTIDVCIKQSAYGLMRDTLYL